MVHQYIIYSIFTLHLAGGAAEPPPPDPIYRHPSSPNYGANWTKETVVFDNIKLSNKATSSDGGKKIALNSLHRYLKQFDLAESN